MKESPIFTHTYDLLLWLIPHVVKFPRVHRFGLGERVTRQALDLQETLIAAGLRGWCGAAPGTTIVTTPAAPTATGTNPITSTTIWVSGWSSATLLIPARSAARLRAAAAAKNGRPVPGSRWGESPRPGKYTISPAPGWTPWAGPVIRA